MLSGVVTDILPAHVTPTGSLTWPLTNLSLTDVWTQAVVVTVTLGYRGILTNRVQVTTREGADRRESSHRQRDIGYRDYLPLVLKD